MHGEGIASQSPGAVSPRDSAPFSTSQEDPPLPSHEPEGFSEFIALFERRPGRKKEETKRRYEELLLAGFKPRWLAESTVEVATALGGGKADARVLETILKALLAVARMTPSDEVLPDGRLPKPPGPKAKETRSAYEKARERGHGEKQLLEGASASAPSGASRSLRSANIAETFGIDD